MTTAEQVMAPLAPRSAAVVAERRPSRRHSRSPHAREAIKTALGAVLSDIPTRSLRRGHRGEGRRVRRDPRPAYTLGAGRLRPASHRRDLDPGSPSASAVSGFLHPEIQYLAYLHNAEISSRGGLHAPVLLPAFFATGWGFGSPATATSAASADTSTTTDAVERFATFPVSSSPRPRVPTTRASMLVTCAEAHSSTGRCASSSSSSRLPPPRRPDRRRRGMGRRAVVDARSHRVCTDDRGGDRPLPIVTWANGLHPLGSVAGQARRRRHPGASSISAGLRRFPWKTCSARRASRGVCSSSTRHGARGMSRRA